MSFHHTEQFKGLILHEKNLYSLLRHLLYWAKGCFSRHCFRVPQRTTWHQSEVIFICVKWQRIKKDKTATQKRSSRVTTLYPRRLPFCSCSGTGPQVTRMRLELMASTVTFSGAPDGTTQTEKDKSHSLITLCLNKRPRVLSKLTWISHFSNVIREKRKQTALPCEQQTRVWAWGDSEQTTKRRQTFNTRPHIRQHSQPRTSLCVGY